MTSVDNDDQERYCSSYYDRHGLYNDGFPCPEGKYCCQNDHDGTKSCCDIVKRLPPPPPPSSVVVKGHHRPSSNKHLSAATSRTILNTISTPHRINSDYYDTAAVADSSTSRLFNSSALAPLFLANSNLIIITGISLAILLLTTLLIIACICRCFKKAAENKSSSGGGGIKDYKNILISHPKPLYDYKLNSNGQLIDDTNTNNRRLGGHGSNTTTTAGGGSSSSRNTTMILMSSSSSSSSHQTSMQAPPAYSRNSGSVASTTSGVSTGSSSLHSSPKANQLLTVCCDNNNSSSGENSQSTKTILTSSCLNTATSSSVNLNLNGKLQQMMLNSNRSSVSNQTNSMATAAGATLAAHSLFNPSRNYMAMLSASGGAGGTSVTLAPMATSSLVGVDINEMALNDLCHDDDDDDDDVDSDLLDQMNENDYIMNTSSNLEFLKAHSLFNKTAPLNFYPSLSMPPPPPPPVTTEINKPVQRDNKTDHAAPLTSVIQNTPNKSANLLNASMSSSSSSSGVVDLRFSTFLPTK